MKNNKIPLILALLGGWLWCAAALGEPRGGSTVQATALRESGANNAAVLLELPAQTRLTVLERQGGWYQVQTANGQRGWLPLLAVRFDSAAGAQSSSLASLLKSTPSAAPGSGVATGVRGVTDEQLGSGASSGGGVVDPSLQQLDRFAVSSSDAEAFARAGGLRSHVIAYTPDN